MVVNDHTTRRRNIDAMNAVHWVPIMKAQRDRSKHYHLFRDADMALRDDPFILIHSSVCKSSTSRRRDPAPLYARIY